MARSVSCQPLASEQSLPICARHRKNEGGKHQHARAEANPFARLRTTSVSKYRMRRVNSKQKLLGTGAAKTPIGTSAGDGTACREQMQSH